MPTSAAFRLLLLPVDEVVDADVVVEEGAREVVIEGLEVRQMGVEARRTRLRRKLWWSRQQAKRSRRRWVWRWR